jgi:hypothetical protein
MLAMFSTKAFHARIQACSLYILEKANRSQGRDAKPRAGWLSVGSPVAERVKTSEFGR